MPKPGPDDIVDAQRKEGYGDVIASDHGDWPEGGIIPMRYEEAVGREDCFPVDKNGKPIVEEEELTDASNPVP